VKPAHAPRKRFGQHFLHDPQVIGGIVRALGAKPGETIVEIGPGLGALTKPLLDTVGNLHVVELDRDLVPRLQALGHGLHVHQGDALKFDFRRLAHETAAGKLRIVGNLPYNISTPLIFHLLEQSDVIADMLFMLQKEVVARLAARPGSKEYGRLSVAVAARAGVEALFDVGRGAFNPPPKVESAVVRLVPRPPPFAIDDMRAFNDVVTRAFSQRRKTLANALRAVIDRESLRTLGLDPGTRPEQLSAGEFASIANFLHARNPHRQRTPG
jgi:16S rRNA (adenine1518-N6/adenine1519-N6)-dimethyltransferase